MTRTREYKIKKTDKIEHWMHGLEKFPKEETYENELDHWRKGLERFPKEETYEEYIRKLNKNSSKVIKKKM